MSNIKESEKIAVASRITGKVDDYSIAKTDVANTFNEIIDLLGAVLVNVDIIYPKGFVVYTASPFSVYVAQVNDVTGDTSNATNWLKIAGSGLPYLVSNTEVYDAVLSYNVTDYYVTVAIDMNAKAGCFFALRFNGSSGTSTMQSGYNLSVVASTALEGTSIILQTDTNGVGFTKLAVTTSSGVYDERLAVGSTYLLTKTTDELDADGYLLTKIGSSGMSILKSSITVSTGKYRTGSGGGVSFTLPLSSGLAGEEVLVLTSSSGTFIVTTTSPDTIVNADSLSYTASKLRFVSDGVDKWYYIS